MSVREAPTVNRICDLKDKDRAYKKHLEALAHAKATIDTSAPDVPNRLKVKSRSDARYRQAVVSEQATRKKMLARATKGEHFDDEDFNEDEVIKKFSEDADRFDTFEERVAEDEVKREVRQKVKIGFTDEPVIEEEIVEHRQPRKSPAAKAKPAGRGRVPGQARTPLKGQQRPARKETVLTTSPVQPEEQEEEKPNLNATGNSLNRSLNRTAQFEDDFIDDEEDGEAQHEEEHHEEEEALPPRPKTAPRTPRSSRPGTAKSTENFEQTFEDDFEEDEIGVVPALRENENEPGDDDGGNFDEMPDFELGVPHLDDD